MSMNDIYEQPDFTLETAFKKRDEITNVKGVKALIWGEPGAGKTYFALTFPEPIYVIDTDGGVAQLLKQFEGKDIRIMSITDPYAEKAKKKAKDPLTETDPVVSLQKFDKATWLLKDIKEGTIVVDGISDIWEWHGAWLDIMADKYTQSGNMMRTEWGKANAKYTWMLKRLKSRPCNLVMTAKQKSKFDKQGVELDEKLSATQKFTEYEPDFVIHLKKQRVGNVTQRIGTVTKCRYYDDLSTVNLINPTYDLLKQKYASKVPEWVFQ